MCIGWLGHMPDTSHPHGCVNPSEHIPRADFTTLTTFSGRVYGYIRRYIFLESKNIYPLIYIICSGKVVIVVYRKRKALKIKGFPLCRFLPLDFRSGKSGKVETIPYTSPVPAHPAEVGSAVGKA